MVQHEMSCITPDQCPQEVTPTRDDETVCPNGMEFRECGSACPQTCDDKEPFCTSQCVEGKCGALYGSLGVIR